MNISTVRRICFSITDLKSPSLQFIGTENTPDDRIDVDIYDMGNALQAFGVFSRFRQEGSGADIGLDSSLGDHHAIFYKGRYFVVLQAVDTNPLALKRFAIEIESRISDNAGPPKEIEYFPKDGLKPGSIEYFPDGLLGYQFLTRGFKASYVEKDEKKTDSKTVPRTRSFICSCLFLIIPRKR